MNTPNKLTVLRILLCPVFVLFLLWDGVPGHYLWAMLVFAAASLTDLLDGKIARKYGLVTDFGKFLDPRADKVLVFCALIAFIELGLASSVAVILMMAREFMVTSLRLVAAGKGTVIAAGSLGKLKTAMTMVSIVVTLALTAAQEMGFLLAVPVAAVSGALVWVAAALTVISGVDYLWQNRSQILLDK